MKHLELVQNAIGRMGTNASALKGYCMAIVAALVGLAGAIEKPRILFLGIPIVLVFAVLDASYLALERGFRSHFDELRVRPLETQPDFDIRPAGSHSALRCVLSWSVAGFYGAALAILVAVGVLL